MEPNSSMRAKVLDMSTHWSGSVASRHLAHLGADVVKLESPTIGDGNRGLAPFIAGEGLSHIVLNAGKRSVTADRKSAGWENLLRRSALWADVVIVGSPPAAALARGLDFESFIRRNPRIIYCNVSGYGEIGPWANHPSHGLNTDLAAGLVPIEMVDGLPVARADYRSVGTTLAGVHAAMGILEALRRRDHGAGAQRVSTSVWECAMFWQWRDIASLMNLDVLPPAYADLGSRYAMYATSDERIVLVCPIERKFWEVFCDLLSLPPEWKSVGSWAKSGMDWGKDRYEERQLIAARFRARPLSDWIALLEQTGIPFSPLYAADEAARSSQAEALAVTASTLVNGKRVQIPNIPIHLTTFGDGAAALSGPKTLAPPPSLGAHTEEFLTEIQAGDDK